MISLLQLVLALSTSFAALESFSCDSARSFCNNTIATNIFTVTACKSSKEDTRLVVAVAETAVEVGRVQTTTAKHYP